MIAIKTKKIDGCLEGTNVKDILLSDAISQEFIEKIAILGKLIFYEDLQKPFFKVIVKGKYTIKGSIGNKSIRVVLPKEDNPQYFQDLIDFING